MLVNYLTNPFKRFITGHCVASPSVVREYHHEWNFITVLRNPVDRFISEYIYNKFKKSEWAKVDLSIEVYLKSSVAHAKGVTIANYFSGLSVKELDNTKESTIVDLVLDNLNHFKSVGFVDDMANWSTSLSEKLGEKISFSNKNTSPNSSAFLAIKNDPALLDKIKELCALDLKIYDLAKIKFG
ncbi:hypothetical protein GMES_0894 [Paraglaciecola mesophila KMM 241]|uniref:Sulfotransferase family protein n=1 Tax=Paraglaciecola mesophila KMM 241 TaxID=1128912 RepID=K6XRE6_9ALTE